MATQVQRRRGTNAENDAFVGALAEFTYDSGRKTIHVHDGETSGGFIVVKYAVSEELTGATKCKITYDSQGRVTGGADLDWESDLRDVVAGHVVTPLSITAATKCKITYNSQGQVTGGADLSVSDLPDGIPQTKVDGLVSSLGGKMPQIYVETPGTEGNQQGNITLVDNSVNKVIAAGSITFGLPTIPNENRNILHQIVVQLYKPNENYSISVSNNAYYFGSDTAPDLSSAGYYNIYFEYDPYRNLWCWGAIKKMGPA